MQLSVMVLAERYGVSVRRFHTHTPLPVPRLKQMVGFNKPAAAIGRDAAHQTADKRQMLFTLETCHCALVRPACLEHTSFRF